MRYGIILLVIAVLGIGEYAFVEFYPLTPRMRVQKFEKLPIVRQVIAANEARFIEEAFKNDDDGRKSYVIYGKHYSWDSAESLLADAKSGDWKAKSLIRALKFANDMRRSVGDERKSAESGSLFDITAYYFKSQFLDDKTDSLRAAGMLMQHPSAEAEFVLTLAMRENVDWNSRETVLLRARLARENLRHPGLSEEDYVTTSGLNAAYLRGIRTQAEVGEADAIWVVGKLDSSSVWVPNH